MQRRCFNCVVVSLSFKQMLSEFERFSVLWKIHIHEEFQKFLNGGGTDSTPSRTPSIYSEAELSRSTSAARYANGIMSIEKTMHFVWDDGVL